MTKRSTRGVFERPPGSGIWWVHYYFDGKRRREKVGRKSDAIALYQKRKVDARAGIKLPDNLRAKPVSFTSIAQAALLWSKAHKRAHKADEIKIRS